MIVSIHNPSLVARPRLGRTSTLFRSTWAAEICRSFPKEASCWSTILKPKTAQHGEAGA